MAELPLRSYLHEIEDHIESGRTDQAIAHSRYILQTYPKYVDAYRLLGKAYLESQRFTDANDIFQRVLSSVPDDFVSHVGMSIIREDEGNMDEAIWHMEHAFEVQPSNNAIQAELRRLYGRRDNFEPPKIRLTRGALARLYTRGELYQQAIAEIRASLGENSNRLDLQALLAEVYLKTDQRVEAADMALAVLRRLPNCVVANQVMVQVLSGTDRETELKTHRDRLHQLDPYAAFTPPGSLNTQAVPDQAVKIEKLEWRPDSSMTDTSQPAWAASLGVDMEEITAAQPEPMPDWLIETTPDQQIEQTSPESPASAFIIDEEEEILLVEEGMSAEQPEPLPSFPEEIDETAWTTEEVSQAEPGTEFEGVSEEEILDSEGALEAAEIPDWLKALAPAEEGLSRPTGEQDITPWVEQALSSGQIEESEESVKKEVFEGLPDWLLETESEPQIEIDEELGIAMGAQAEPPARFDQEAVLGSDAFESPEMATEIPATSKGEVEIPDWLKALQSDSGPVVPGQLESELEAQLEAELDSRDWDQRMGELRPDEAAEDLAVGAAATAAASDIPEWLLESAAGEAEFEALEGQAEIAGFSEELPDWLRRVDEYSTETDFKGTGTESELPDWLLEVQETPESLPGEEIDLVMAKAFPAEDQPESIFETEEPILGDTQPTRIRTTVDTTHLEGEIALEPEPETEAILDEGVELEGMAEIEEAVEIEMADVLEVVEEVELAEGRVEASEIRVEEELEEPVALKVEAELEEAAQLEGEAPIVLEAGIPEELIPVETIQDVMEAPAPALQGELDEAFAWLMALQAPSKSVEAPDEAAVESSLEIETSALEPEWGEAPVQLADEGAPEDLSETEGIEVDAVEQDARIETVEESRINAESILAELDAELIEQEAEFEWLESLAVPAGEKEEPAVETEAPLQTTAEDAGVTFDESLETEPDVTYRDVDEVFANPAESGLSGAVEEAKSSEIAEAAAEETSPAGLEMVETPSTRDEEIETVVEIGTPEKKVEAEIPDLPDWLSEAGAPSEELEWAPPPAPHRRYELNLASFNEIEALPGIGTETARKMIEYREQHGPFHLIEDLLKIPGFGLMTLEGVRDYLYVEYAEPEPVEVDAGGLPEIEGISTELGEARSALTEGNLSQAMDSYARIIASNQELDLVARDLEEAAYRFPEEADVWQNLGDAYLRLEQVQAALKSYIKAEQLLR